MGVAARHGRTLRATLCEIEHGVFYATYADASPDADGLVAYQIGTSAAEAKETIEADARALGYETVEWAQSIVAPLFASPDFASTGFRKAARAGRRGVAATFIVRQVPDPAGSEPMGHEGPGPGYQPSMPGDPRGITTRRG